MAGEKSFLFLLFLFLFSLRIRLVVTAVTVAQTNDFPHRFDWRLDGSLSQKRALLHVRNPNRNKIVAPLSVAHKRYVVMAIHIVVQSPMLPDKNLQKSVHFKRRYIFIMSEVIIFYVNPLLKNIRHGIEQTHCPRSAPLASLVQHRTNAVVQLAVGHVNWLTIKKRCRVVGESFEAPQDSVSKGVQGGIGGDSHRHALDEIRSGRHLQHFSVVWLFANRAGQLLNLCVRSRSSSDSSLRGPYSEKHKKMMAQGLVLVSVPGQMPDGTVLSSR